MHTCIDVSDVMEEHWLLQLLNGLCKHGPNGFLSLQHVCAGGYLAT